MEAIVKHRWNKKLKKWQFLVKWKDCPKSYNSWLDADAFNGETSGRRDLLQYVHEHLDKDQARNVRLGSAGAAKPRKIVEEQPKPSDFGPDEEEKVGKEVNAQPGKDEVEQINTYSTG